MLSVLTAIASPEVLAATADVVADVTVTAPPAWLKFVSHPMVLAILVPIMTAGLRSLLNISTDAKTVVRSIAGILAVLVAVMSGVANGTIDGFAVDQAITTLADSLALFFAATGAYKMLPQKQPPPT